MTRPCGTIRSITRAAFFVALGLHAAHADPRQDLGATTCAALDRAVTTQPGGPLLLASYLPSQD